MTVNLIRNKSLQHSNLREELMEPLRKTVVREYCRDLPTPCSKRTDKKNYSLSFSFNALSNFLSSACSAAQYKKEVWMACHSIDLRHGPLAVEKLSLRPQLHTQFSESITAICLVYYAL